ncbi:MAG: ABC transporter ATP-binding protein [Acidimicrobiales bacterium]|jgi:ABC-type multidrug transport system ATPase subunit
MAPAVSLRDAVALAGRFPLLAGVTLDVGEGEIVHLSGPNGAGKSSLLRLCCGLLSLRSGSAVVLGHDLAVDRRAVRLLIGYLGHETFLYEELTVEENLRFALRAAGSGAAEARVQAEGAMARLALTGRLPSTPVGKLSAGQRRRTAIAVVVGRRPRLWLLDEPHAGLDHDARSTLDEVILEARAGGATVMLSSHELGESDAHSLADRVVHLAGGRVVPAPPTVDGDPDAAASPANPPAVMPASPAVPQGAPKRARQSEAVHVA